MLRLHIFWKLKMKFIKCSKVFLKINDFELRAQQMLFLSISRHEPLYTDLTTLFCMWNMNCRIQEYLKVREKIQSRSEFQFKNCVFLNIRKILRLKEMVLTKKWQFFGGSVNFLVFLFRSIGIGYHSVISPYFKTVIMKHPVD